MRKNLTKIIVRGLKRENASRYARLVSRVILGTAMYSRRAREQEAQNHSARSVRAQLPRRSNIFLEAVRAGTLEGFCFGSIYGGVMWVEWLGTERRSRGQGVAQHLLLSLESRLRTKKVRKIWLDTRTNNNPSIALFRSLGYRKVGTLRSHWYGHDYFIWEKRLK